MLIEPTETESKSGLDRFTDVLEALAIAAKAGEKDRFLAAPVHAPTKRLDETRAARQPVLRWTPPADELEAAE
jgi:glycine dehydrogenase subunit 2